MSQPSYEVLWGILSLPRALRTYPEHHPRVAKILQEMLEQLGRLGRELRIECVEGDLVVDGHRDVQPAHIRLKLADAFAARGIASVRLPCRSQGTELRELSALLGASAEAVATCRANGGANFAALQLCWRRDAASDAAAAAPPGAPPSSPQPATARDRAPDLPEGGAATADMRPVGAWETIAMDALRGARSTHDPEETAFAILCDLYFRAPSEADRNLRRRSIERTVQKTGRAGALLASVLRRCGDDVALRRQLLLVALPSAPADDIVRLGEELACLPRDRKLLSAACQGRPDAAALLARISPGEDRT